MTDDAWAQVELWRWQYGSLPRPDDERALSPSIGAVNMAKALLDRNIKPQDKPDVFNVASVLQYLAKEQDHLLSENDKLRKALRSLANEASGFVSMANPQDHGNTNIAVMKHWIDNARQTLSEIEKI